MQAIELLKPQIAIGKHEAAPIDVPDKYQFVEVEQRRPEFGEMPYVEQAKGSPMSWELLLSTDGWKTYTKLCAGNIKGGDWVSRKGFERASSFCQSLPMVPNRSVCVVYDCRVKTPVHFFMSFK